jgi:hypothetical protein
LLNLIVKSDAGRPKVRPKLIKLDVLLDLMLDTMLGSDYEQRAGCFCGFVLMRLGLVVEDSRDDWMPTVELLNLFTKSYYDRASQRDL